MRRRSGTVIDLDARTTARVPEARRPELVEQLYAHARTYIHGHSVGGTNPSLLRAMGARTSVLAWDVTFTREVLGEAGVYFDTIGALAELVNDAESDPAQVDGRAGALQARAQSEYRWDAVTDRYEALCLRLADASGVRPKAAGRRLGSVQWNLERD